jgi:hypothetical protein
MLALDIGIRVRMLTNESDATHAIILSDQDYMMGI